MIAGHEAVTDGDILIGGQNVTGLPPIRRGTAMMFQSYALFPHLNCLDNVAFSLKMRGVGKAERHRDGARVPGAGAYGAIGGAAAVAAFRRAAAACRAGACADHPAARAAARRAAVGARSVPARARCARS